MAKAIGTAGTGSMGKRGGSGSGKGSGARVMRERVRPVSG